MIKCVSCKKKKSKLYDICIHLLKSFDDIYIFAREKVVITCEDCYFSYKKYNNLILRPICFKCLIDVIDNNSANGYETIFEERSETEQPAKKNLNNWLLHII